VNISRNILEAGFRNCRGKIEINAVQPVFLFVVPGSYVTRYLILFSKSHDIHVTCPLFALPLPSVVQNDDERGLLVRNMAHHAIPN
jgi:hypothetical protein